MDRLRSFPQSTTTPFLSPAPLVCCRAHRAPPHRTPTVACILTSLIKIVNATTALTGTVTAVTPDSFQVALGATTLTLKTLSPRITDYVGTLEQSAL